MVEHSPANEPAPIVLQAGHFEPLVGRDVRFGDTGVTLVLVSVDRPRGGLPEGMPRKPFSLIFSGP